MAREKNSLILRRHDWANNLGLFAYASAVVALPVLLIEIMADFGTSLEFGGRSLAALLGLARNVSITLSLIFSGFASLFWGTRRCLRFAMVSCVLFMLLSASSPNYLILLVSLALVGIGEGLIEGLITPFVEQLHRSEAEDCNRYVNLAHSFWPAGIISTTIIVGLLLSRGLDWRWIMAGIASMYLLPIILMGPNKVLRKSQGKLQGKAQERTQAKNQSEAEPQSGRESGTRFAISMRDSLQKMWQILCFWPFWRFSATMFLAGGAEISLTFWAASFVQLHYGSSAFFGGLSTALFALGMLLGRVLAAHYLPAPYMRPTLLCCTLCGAVATFFLALATTLWLFLVLLFLAGLCTATYWPSIQVYAVQKFPKLNSTSLFILLSAAGIPGAGFFPWLLGLISDSTFLPALFSLSRSPFLYSSPLSNPFVLSLLVVPLCHLGIFVLLWRK